MTTKDWRSSARHTAALIYMALTKWVDGQLFYPNPGKPLPRLDSYWASLRNDLLADAGFRAWVDSQLIAPMRAIESENPISTEEVQAVCARLSALMGRLKDGGTASDLAQTQGESKSDEQGSVIDGPPDSLAWLSPSQIARCDPIKQAIRKLATDSGGSIPTPQEIWQADGLRIEDLARLAERNVVIRDLLNDLAMLARRIDGRFRSAGFVNGDEHEQALPKARELRDLMASIGVQWRVYAQDAFVVPIEGVRNGNGAVGRLFDLCHALRHGIDRARAGLVPIESRARITPDSLGGKKRMLQSLNLSAKPKKAAILERYQQAARRWPWVLENGSFEIPPWLGGNEGESPFATVERGLLWLINHPSAIPSMSPTRWEAWELSDHRPDYLEARASEVLCATDVIRSDPSAGEVHRLLALPTLSNIREALAHVQNLMATGTPKGAGSADKAGVDPSPRKLEPQRKTSAKKRGLSPNAMSLLKVLLEATEPLPHKEIARLAGVLLTTARRPLQNWRRSKYISEHKDGWLLSDAGKKFANKALK